MKNEAMKGREGNWELGRKNEMERMRMKDEKWKIVNVSVNVSEIMRFNVRVQGNFKEWDKMT